MQAGVFAGGRLELRRFFRTFLPITPRDQLWEEELAILVGSLGSYRATDVRAMSPEKRHWTLKRLDEISKQRGDQKQEQEGPKGPTVKGKPVPLWRR
jgi:hypothetical protein